MAEVFAGRANIDISTANSLNNSNSQTNETAKNNKVAVPGTDHIWMSQYWGHIDLVADGHYSALRSVRSIIFQQYSEAQRAYESRLKHLDFLPLFAQLVGLSASILTRKSVTQVFNDGISEETKELIKEHLEDIDSMGNSIDVFLHDFLNKHLLRYSIAYVMVDAPVAPVNSETGEIIPLSIADEAILGLRPYWLAISAKDVLDVRWRMEGAKRVVHQVRIRTTIKEVDGDYHDKEVMAVKVYDLINSPVKNSNGDQAAYVQCRTFTKNDKNEWGELATLRGVVSLPYIPIFCININPEQCFRARPELYDLATLNISHTRASSNLAFGLDQAAHPKLKRTRTQAFSATAGSSKKPVNMSPDKVLDAEPGEDYEWLSAPSDAFAAQERRIKKFEEDAKTLWLTTIQSQQNFAESGISKSIGQNQGSSKLLRIAIAMESLLECCMQAHFDMMDKTAIGEDAPICLSVNRDLDVMAMTQELAKAFSDMVTAQQLSNKSFLMVLRRGQLLPEDFDVEEEVELLQLDPYAAQGVMSPEQVLNTLLQAGKLPTGFDIAAAIAMLEDAGPIEQLEDP